MTFGVFSIIFFCEKNQACQQSISMQYRIDFPMENALFEFQGSHYDVNVRIEGPEIDALKFRVPT